MNRTRIATGRDQLKFLDNISTETTGFRALKMVFNSVVSIPDAKFVTKDVGSIYYVPEYTVKRLSVYVIH